MSAIKLMRELALRKKQVTDWTDDEVRRAKNELRACFDNFQETLDKASIEGQSIYIKEHVHCLIDPPTLNESVFGSDSSRGAIEPWLLGTSGSYGEETRSRLNETLFPDEFWKTWLPTFLIRHPALAFPSLLRVTLELEGTGDENEDKHLGQHCLTMRWTRSLYDWYADNMSQVPPAQTDPSVVWPIILDADDIMANREVVVKYCELLGMDLSRLAFSWTPASDDQQSQMEGFRKRYLATLLASGGIVKDKVAGDGIDLEKEAKSWREEFGGRAGDRLERLVKDAMPDYEFLKARRLTA